MIDLSIVIVTWNAKAVLLDCLESIDRQVRLRRDGGQIDIETLVVDNGSLDGSVGAVRERFPWAEVIALPENIGFAGGNNVGLRRAKGRHVVLLNSDTIVLHDSLEKCVRYLNSHPDVGIVGLQLLNPDGSKQNCIHNFPSLATEIVPKGLLETLFPRRFPSKRYHHSSPIEVEAVLGACLFARREVLDTIGLLPEDYFFFLEETDWCFRVKQAGWRVVHVPDAHVIHIFGVSTRKKVPAETRIEYHRSLYHFFRKNRGAPQTAVVVAFRTLKGILYVVVGGPPAVLSRRGRDRWWQDWKVLWWHMRGCPAREGLAQVRDPDAGGKK
ncbi:MAG: glycosyltransferase family 2 protein [Candidatus Methylomirabilales bacterium]